MYNDIRKQELYEHLMEHSELDPINIEVLTDAIDDFVHGRLKDLCDAIAEQFETKRLM